MAGPIDVEFRSGGLALEGRLRVPAGAGPWPAVAVCHPHPQFEGSMDNNVVYALEDWIATRGIATLAFNFRGVGRSQGRYDGQGGEAGDVVAALTCLAKRPEIDGARVGVAGYSFGGLMAAYATAMLESAGNGEPERLRAAAVALVSPMSPGGPWERAAELKPFYDRPGPVIIVAGTADQFFPINSAKDLAHQIGMNARLVAVEGADHFWSGFEDDAAGAAAEFFGRTL